MKDLPSQPALARATLALVAALACGTALLPPMAAETLRSLPRTALASLGLVLAMAVHVVYVGIAAARQQRSVAFFAGLALLLAPIGSVAALVLLGWPQAPASPTPRQFSH